MAYIRTYIGSRYVPIFVGPYSPTTPYSAMTVVDVGSDKYISRTNVPAGTPVTDTKYWSWYTKSADTQYNELRELIATAESNSTSAVAVANAASLAVSNSLKDISALTTRVTKAESDITTLTSAINSFYHDMTDITTNVNSALTDVSNMKTTVTKLDTDFKALDSTVKTFDGRIKSNTDDISSLKTRATAHESNIANLSTDMGTVTGTVAGMGTDISTLKTDVAKNSTDIASVGDRVTKLEQAPGVDPELDNRVKALETSQTAQDSKITGLESWQTTQTNLVQGLGTSVDTLKTDVSGLKTEDTNIKARLDAIESGGTGGGDPELTNRVSALESSQSAQDTKISGLESWQTTQTSLVQGLSNTVSGLQTDVNNISQTVTDIDTNVIPGLSSQVGSNTESVNNLLGRVAGVENTNVNQGNSISSLLTRVSNLEQGGSSDIPVYVYNLSKTMTNGSGTGSSSTNPFSDTVYIDKPGIYLVNVAGILNASSGNGVMYYDVNFSIGGSGSNAADYDFNFAIVYSTAAIRIAGGTNYALRAYPQARTYGRVLTYPNESTTYKRLISTDTAWGTVFSTIFYGSINYKTTSSNCRIYQAQQTQKFTM